MNESEEHIFVIFFKSTYEVEPIEYAQKGGSTHRWKIRIETLKNLNAIKRVTFEIHETFPNPRQIVNEPPFEIQEEGFGEFDMTMEIKIINRRIPVPYAVKLPDQKMTIIQYHHSLWDHIKPKELKAILDIGGIPLKPRMSDEAINKKCLKLSNLVKQSESNIYPQVLYPKVYERVLHIIENLESHQDTNYGHTKYSSVLHKPIKPEMETKAERDRMTQKRKYPYNQSRNEEMSDLSDIDEIKKIKKEPSNENKKSSSFAFKQEKLNLPKKTSTPQSSSKSSKPISDRPQKPSTTKFHADLQHKPHKIKSKHKEPGPIQPIPPINQPINESDNFNKLFDPETVIVVNRANKVPSSSQKIKKEAIESTKKSIKHEPTNKKLSSTTAAMKSKKSWIPSKFADKKMPKNVKKESISVEQLENKIFHSDDDDDDDDCDDDDHSMNDTHHDDENEDEDGRKKSSNRPYDKLFGNDMTSSSSDDDLAALKLSTKKKPIKEEDTVLHQHNSVDNNVMVDRKQLFGDIDDEDDDDDDDDDDDNISGAFKFGKKPPLNLSPHQLTHKLSSASKLQEEKHNDHRNGGGGVGNLTSSSSASSAEYRHDNLDNDGRQVDNVDNYITMESGIDHFPERKYLMMKLPYIKDQQFIENFMNLMMDLWLEGEPSISYDKEVGFTKCCMKTIPYGTVETLLKMIQQIK